MHAVRNPCGTLARFCTNLDHALAEAIFNSYERTFQAPLTRTEYRHCFTTCQQRESEVNGHCTAAATCSPATMPTLRRTRVHARSHTASARCVNFDGYADASLRPLDGAVAFVQQARHEYE